MDQREQLQRLVGQQVVLYASCSLVLAELWMEKR